MVDSPSQLASLSVQQIRTFCGVYEHGGYAGAEESLGLTGPTMWEQIKALEGLYRVKLFQRSGRNIVPTRAGDTLYRVLTPLLANLESTLDILNEDNLAKTKLIRLATGMRMIQEELTESLAEFHQRYPDIQLKLMTSDNRSAQVAVLDGRVDLALMIEPPHSMLATGVQCQRLYPIDYLAALPPRHRLSRKSEISLAELAGEPLILGNADTTGRQVIEQAFFRLGIQGPLRVAVETDNSAVTLACVRAGLGIGIIAGRPQGYLMRHVTSRTLARDLGQVHVVAMYRAGRLLTGVFTDLVASLGRLAK